MSIELVALRRDIHSLADSKRAKALARFFKTGPGEYGEGDVFLGITAPQCREVVKKYKNLVFSDIETLLRSKYHEERMIGLLILVSQFPRADEAGKKRIFDFYLAHTKSINNWDLVDVTTPRIVGAHLLSKNWSLLKKLATSTNLWERRIAIMATLPFIIEGDAKPTLTISAMLVHDKHDLIHKAVGWMLREVGKRVSREKEEKFLKKYYVGMPRTMLRYAIEQFPKPLRKEYLHFSKKRVD